MAGYSSRSLVDKLGIKEGWRIAILNAPAGYARTLGTLPAGLRRTPRPRGPLDFVQFFTPSWTWRLWRWTPCGRGSNACAACGSASRRCPGVRGARGSRPRGLALDWAPMPELVTAPPLTKLSEEEELFRDTVRGFAEREVRPRVAAMERAAAIEPALLAKCFELGLMGIETSEALGGSGGSLLLTVLAVEELSAVDPAVAIFVDVQNTLVNTLLRKWASEALQRRYLPRLASDLLGAYALSEPESGSDAFGLQTRATRAGDKWMLEGRKLWITNGAEAGLVEVVANSDFAKGYKGITAFA